MLSKKEIYQRQRKGIAAAKKKGKYHGRKPLTADDPKIKKAFTLYFRYKLDHGISNVITPAARKAGISRQTLYRKLKQFKPKPQHYLSQLNYDRWILRYKPYSEEYKKIINAARKIYHRYGFKTSNAFGEMDDMDIESMLADGFFKYRRK